MWAIDQLNHPGISDNCITFSDGKPISTVRGPAGASFRLNIKGYGFLDVTDTGHQPGGPFNWQLLIGGNIYWYSGQGAIELNIQTDGGYHITGNGNDFSGKLTQFPTLAKEDVSSFDWMVSNKYIPYQKIPDEPGKTTEEIKKLGLQYFPYSDDSFELAMSLYDWTTADFTRIDFMRLFAYTGVNGQPLDKDSIATSIWTANWNTYNPKDKAYMNSFMMQPAFSLDDVRKQLNKKASLLLSHNKSESALINAALSGMPRTSCLAKPTLYSGQVAIFNLGTKHFATYFLELPANSNPSLPPLEMELESALNSFLSPGKVVTLKTFMAFTDSFEDAQHYSNGIIIVVSPPEGAITWNNCAYITPLSDGPTKTEYLFETGTQFKVMDIKKVTVKEKNLTQLELQVV